jgi:hypothetical protein
MPPSEVGRSLIFGGCTELISDAFAKEQGKTATGAGIEKAPAAN